MSIPANSKAIVCLPTTDVNMIKEFGRPITQQKGITLVETVNGKTKWAIGSGSYLFEVFIGK